MKKIKILVAIFSVSLTLSCTKYLDAVPDSALTIPQTYFDFQQMLENEKMFTSAPALGELGTDDIALTDDIIASRTGLFLNGYIYAKEIFGGLKNSDWNSAYEKIYYANIVLEGLEKIKDHDIAKNDFNLLRGWALFCRAHAFYDLQEVFGQPYRPASANNDIGIPLRLTSNLNEVAGRATVAVTYQQIVKDLEESIQLLPGEVSKINRSKPSKSAAYALLARVYLIMQEYNKSLNAAENSLNLYKSLIDYNVLNTTIRQPFSPIIDEILYHSLQTVYLPVNCTMDSKLYDTYSNNDLRKVLFFSLEVATNRPAFKGYYSGSSIAYNGICTDEVYLIRSECYARLNESQKALDDLNTLLVKRYKTGLYVPYTIANTTNILQLVLNERRKECVLRNLRWPDLRRLNQDQRFAKTITHAYKGINYQLAPNDPKYVYPIPDDEIRVNGIAQNIR